MALYKGTDVTKKISMSNSLSSYINITEKDEESKNQVKKPTVDNEVTDWSFRDEIDQILDLTDQIETKSSTNNVCSYQ